MLFKVENKEIKTESYDTQDVYGLNEVTDEDIKKDLVKELGRIGGCIIKTQSSGDVYIIPAGTKKWKDIYTMIIHGVRKGYSIYELGSKAYKVSLKNDNYIMFFDAPVYASQWAVSNLGDKTPTIYGESKRTRKEGYMDMDTSKLDNRTKTKVIKKQLFGFKQVFDRISKRDLDNIDYNDQEILDTMYKVMMHFSSEFDRIKM